MYTVAVCAGILDVEAYQLLDTRPTNAFQSMRQGLHKDHRINDHKVPLNPKLSALHRTAIGTGADPGSSLDLGGSIDVGDSRDPSYTRNPQSRLGSTVLSDEQRSKMMAQRSKMMASLHFKQRDARLMSLKPAQAKTCRWMLKKVHYRDWMNAERLNQHRGFFWIKGKPGTGKSTMMKFLFSEARKTMKGHIILSFFFNARGDDLEKSTSGLYRALLLQILEKVPETQSILDYYDVPGFETVENNGWQDEMLRELFTLSLKELENQRVVCYVDALDECPEEDVRDMISFFEELGELEKVAEFRLCFSSRHYPEISIRTGLQLVLESEQEHTDDMTLYVDTHLNLGNSSQAEDIRAEILRKSSGIFLWVHLVIPILNKEYDRGRIKALKKRLAEIPTGLHDLFIDMLTRDQKNVDSFLVGVQIILFALRPLSPEEFREAVETYFEDNFTLEDCDLAQMTSENLRKFVLDTSKGLAEITRSKEPTVQFIHESVRDFLIKEGGLNTLQPTTRNPEATGHDTIKKICSLQLDLFGRARRNEYGNNIYAHPLWYEERRKEIEKKHHSIHYAVEYILYHANWAQKLGIDQLSFLEHFSMANWTIGYNWTKTWSAHINEHLLYALGETGLADLIRVHPQRAQHFEMKGGPYGSILLAAMFGGHSAAARALMDLPPLPEEGSTKSAEAKPLPKFSLKMKNFNKRRSLLSYACEFGDTDIIRSVWKTASFNEDRESIEQCFLYAASEAVVDTLAEWGAFTVIDGDSEDTAEEFSPLHEDGSPSDNSLHHVKMALRKDPSIVDNMFTWHNSQDMLSYAAAKGFDQIARMCFKYTIAEHREAAFVSGINGQDNQSSRISVIEYLIEKGIPADPDTNRKISSSLFDMILLPHNEEVVALLTRTLILDLEIRSSEGMTVLSWAIKQGQKSYVKLFLSAGSDPTTRDNNGHTPLMWAIRMGDLQSFHLILEHEKCEPNAQDQSGRTALSWCATPADDCAIEMGRDLLRRADVDPNLTEHSGQTALMRAVRSGNPKLVKAFLTSDLIDPDLGSHSRSTPLRLAFKLYDEERHRVFWEISR